MQSSNVRMCIFVGIHFHIPFVFLKFTIGSLKCLCIDLFVSACSEGTVYVHRQPYSDQCKLLKLGFKLACGIKIKNKLGWETNKGHHKNVGANWQNVMNSYNQMISFNLKASRHVSNGLQYLFENGFLNHFEKHDGKIMRRKITLPD